MTIYRDSRTGIRVINVSHFPEDSASLPRSAFVDDYSAYKRTIEHYWTDTPREVTPRSEIEETQERDSPEPEVMPEDVLESDQEDAESGRTPVAMPATPNSGVQRSRPGTPRIPKVHVATLGLEI
eukprot:10411395-Karenia_brevis.AAC.1